MARVMQPLPTYEHSSRSTYHGIFVPAPFTAILSVRRIDTTTTAAQARPREWNSNAISGPSAAAPTRPGIVIWGPAAALADTVSSTWTPSTGPTSSARARGWLAAGCAQRQIVRQLLHVVDKASAKVRVRTKDLHHVLQTPELQHAIIHNPETRHGSLPASTAPLQTLLAQNIGLAKSLKQLEAHVRHQRDDVQSRLLAMRALERQWRAKQSEQDEALREFSPPALYQRLSAAVGEQEALCRGLEESFLDGEGFGGGDAVASDREVTDFVRRLREGRKIAYLRAERKERWDEGRVGGWR